MGEAFPGPSRIRATRALRACLMSDIRPSRTMLVHVLLLPTLVQPLPDEAPNLFIWSEGQCTLVALQGLLVAAEPAKHIGASKVEWRVLFQRAGALDVLKQGKSLDRADCEGDGNRPIQLNDGRTFIAQELFV